MLKACVKPPHYKTAFAFSVLLYPPIRWLVLRPSYPNSAEHRRSTHLLVKPISTFGLLLLTTVINDSRMLTLLPDPSSRRPGSGRRNHFSRNLIDGWLDEPLTKSEFFFLSNIGREIIHNVLLRNCFRATCATCIYSMRCIPCGTFGSTFRESGRRTETKSSS